MDQLAPGTIYSALGCPVCPSTRDSSSDSDSDSSSSLQPAADGSAPATAIEREDSIASLDAVEVGVGLFGCWVAADEDRQAGRRQRS